MTKVRLLSSAVINIDGSAQPYGKGAVIDVSDEVLRSNWQIMTPLEDIERATMPIPTQPIIAHRVARKATVKPKEKRTKK